MYPTRQACNSTCRFVNSIFHTSYYPPHKLHVAVRTVPTIACHNGCVWSAYYVRRDDCVSNVALVTSLYTPCLCTCQATVVLVLVCDLASQQLHLSNSLCTFASFKFIKNFLYSRILHCCLPTQNNNNYYFKYDNFQLM